MKRIMIVDDEILVRIGIKSITVWEDYGYKIVGEAANGIEALGKIEICKPQIILTDLVMDKMDGFELMKQCIHKYPHIKFVVLSSYNDFENVKKAMKLGAKDYIFKLTAKEDEILKILNEIIIVEEDLGLSENNYKTIVKENISAIKSNLFKNLMQQNFINKNEIFTQMRKMELNIDILKSYAIFQISIDYCQGFADTENFRDNQLLKFSVENIIKEILSNEYTIEVFNHDNNEIITIININDKDKYEIFLEDIPSKFNIINEYIKRYLGLISTACISPFATEIVQLASIVKENSLFLKSKIGNERGILYTNEVGIRIDIQKVKEYVKNNLNKNLSIPKISKYINMSESYFSHIFKKEVGMSFVDYVNKIRITKASNLLLETNLTIKQIALIVGIENPNYFSILFKKTTQQTPKKYRENKNV